MATYALYAFHRGYGKKKEDKSDHKYCMHVIKIWFTEIDRSLVLKPDSPHGEREREKDGKDKAYTYLNGYPDYVLFETMYNSNAYRYESDSE